MRVIAGDLGGRRLASGDSPGLRPTTDRVRESIFNILASRLTLEGARILDLYAGTGALGIEALSRGAARCTFVERQRRAVEIIRRNLRDLGLEESSSLLQRDVLDVVGAHDGEPFDLILADPPYASAEFPRLVERVLSPSLLAPGGLFLLEHGGTMTPPAEPVEPLLRRSFGDTAIALYQLPTPP